ncbi:hypothetical protein Pcinc_022576 [Petrolisthes cinctipes]|uniref:Uncharacterized protein n=1 Tax=Petrolisthes cinctipes TaxID=88211 RepID=A0AAE1FFA4_PETCI|nr:hypothetical protein Pcinc_022576 [Petrolisthes cinctipes]
MGLKFVQFQKNTSYHSGIKQSPYKALFGVEARVGLRSTALPEEVLKTMITEEDLLGAYSFPSDSTRPDDSLECTNPPDASLECINPPDDSPECMNRPDDSPELLNSPDDSPESMNPPDDPPECMSHPDDSTECSTPPNDSPEDFAQPDGSSEVTAYRNSPPCDQNPQGRLHKLQENITLQRSRAAAGQLAQAERMVKRSRLEHVPGNPGDNVTIPIPLVD